VTGAAGPHIAVAVVPNLRGSCHCGRIAVDLSTNRHPAIFNPRACQCGFCRRHAAAMISDPNGRLTIETSGESDDIYRLGFGITDFHVCARCGVFVAATWQDQGNKMLGVVNIRVMDDARLFITAPTEIDFANENPTVRKVRRRTNWTPTKLAVSGP
jgi:hypothetical protein